MKRQEFHISTLAAVVHNQIWLAQGGIHAFCDCLNFMMGKDDNNIWNSDKIRRACKEELELQLPFLLHEDLCDNCADKLDAWRKGLEQKFGTHFTITEL